MSSMARAANPAGVYRLERPCCRDDLIRPDLTSAGLLHSLSTTSKSRKLRAEQRLAALSTVDRLLRKRNPDPDVAADFPNPQSAAARIGTNSTIWVGLVVLCPSQRHHQQARTSERKEESSLFGGRGGNYLSTIVGYSGVHGDSTCHTGAGASPAPRRPSYDLARRSGRAR